MILDAHGLRIELPPRWSGRIFSREGGIAALHAGNFNLALADGEFGDRSTGRMTHGKSFLALVEYRHGGGLRPGKGLFGAHRIPRRPDPLAFSRAGLAHPRPGQAGLQEFFTAAGRPFCLYLVIAGGAHPRARQVAELESVLATLRIAPQPE